MSTPTGQQVLDLVDQKIKKEFESNKRILSFDEYLMLLAENPESQLRGSAQYLVDLLDHYGKTPVESPEAARKSDRLRSQIYRFHVFDFPVDGIAPKVVGQEEVQTRIYRAFKSFTRQRLNNKLLLLHGPNGSAKSTLVHSLMGGMERYSYLDEGAVYTFSWVFPLEDPEKTRIGLAGYAKDKEKPESYAKLSDAEVAARIPSELKDHPILLIPVEHRRKLLEQLVGKEKTDQIYRKLCNYLAEGELSHRNKQIFDALLAAHGGDYKKVLHYVQVERFYFARRFRKGLVTIEPQLHVDARYDQITMTKNIQHLPPALQSLNLFSIRGDLVDGNRGIIEYSDLLKRPVDTFKYLLVACETGSVNVGSSIAFLDTVMLGSTNEVQLDAFKEFPDFSSFKARIELIRVPYLLSAGQEKEIYQLIVQQIAGDKPISPHVDWALSLWAVLTRLKKPNSINYPPNVSTIISNLTPIEKARLYDNGEIPPHLSAEDRKLLRTNIKKLKTEYHNIPYYEGRMGASVREIKSLLFDAIQNPDFPCLSPLAIFHEMDRFVKNVSEYDFLKQDVKDGYHDAAEFVSLVRNEYLDIIDREVRDSMGLYDSTQWEEFIQKYVLHVSTLLKKEKIQNTVTGKLEDPDEALIREFEQICDAPREEVRLRSFRQNVISQVGAWSLDHPDSEVAYAEVFPEYWQKLEKHYYETQKATLNKMRNALEVWDTDDLDLSSEGGKLAETTIENMQKLKGYSEEGAKEVIMYLMKKRY